MHPPLGTWPHSPSAAGRCGGIPRLVSPAPSPLKYSCGGGPHSGSPGSSPPPQTAPTGCRGCPVPPGHALRSWRGSDPSRPCRSFPDSGTGECSTSAPSTSEILPVAPPSPLLYRISLFSRSVYNRISILSREKAKKVQVFPLCGILVSNTTAARRPPPFCKEESRYAGLYLHKTRYLCPDGEA